jgi:hypothetical protein
MSEDILARMQARDRAVRARSQIRQWNYRQRNLAAGVWFRLRRILCDARAAYAIADEDAARLQSEGYRAEPCGKEVSPEKTLVFVDEKRLEKIASRRQIRVGRGPDFLSNRAIALVRFEIREP